ncbi:MAG TPA: amidohydrolase [Acidobacteriota bacterium]|jgi:predicted TIM-barrel fold metal-dependent hydrolase
MKIIDTHRHLWDLDLFSYSWCRNIPALNRSFRMNDYREAIQHLNVTKSVHLEADVDEPWMLQETRHILALAAQDNLLQGVVACCRPEKKSFRAYLDQIAGEPALKGVRRVLHTQPDELSQSSLFIENIRSLADYGLCFDICVLARQLPLAFQLVRACPDVSFILDHCGNPLIREGLAKPWRAQMGEMALLPNLVCKISGIVTNADLDHWSTENLRPYVEHVLERFGWDRVIFGSDWPVCTLAASLTEWVEALMKITGTASLQDQEKLFWRNAERIYRLG